MGWDLLPRRVFLTHPCYGYFVLLALSAKKGTINDVYNASRWLAFLEGP